MERSQKTVFILYRNYRGKIAVREIEPIEWIFGSTEHHKEVQWLLRAYDFEKQAERVYAMKEVRGWWSQDDMPVKEKT